MSEEVVLPDTGERMIPEYHKGNLIYAEHYTRYQSALGLVKGKTVLDVASGSGYGTKLLGSAAAKVYGVDVSDEAVAYAKQTYAADNVEFRVGNGMEIPMEDDSVDVVITFETIEHIEDHEKFLREVSRVLRPDGIAIVSTPNDLEFAEGNHYHLHEFEYDELTKSLSKYFKYQDPYFQTTWKAVMIGDEPLMATEGPMSVPTINLAPAKPEEYLYFYIVCSNRPITEKVDAVLALGGHYSDRSVMAGEMDAQATRQRVVELEGVVREKDEANATIQGKFDAVTRELASVRASRAYKLANVVGKVRRRLFGSK